jgi:hypothetical protein
MWKKKKSQLISISTDRHSELRKIDTKKKKKKKNVSLVPRVSHDIQAQTLRRALREIPAGYYVVALGTAADLALREIRHVLTEHPQRRHAPAGLVIADPVSARYSAAVAAGPVFSRDGASWSVDDAEAAAGLAAVPLAVQVSAWDDAPVVKAALTLAHGARASGSDAMVAVSQHPARKMHLMLDLCPECDEAVRFIVDVITSWKE